MDCETPRLILATSTNEGYMQRTLPYLDSLRFCYNPEPWLICLDFVPPGVEMSRWEDFPDINMTALDSRDLKLPLNNFCIQHGEFCDFIPGDPSDVILFTDADLRMQRPFSEEELDTLRNLQTGQFFVGYNAGPNDTLADEAVRLGLKKPYEDLYEMFGPLKFSCFNWGCVAATRATWEHICEIYVRLFPVVDEYLNHVAKQQWLLSWIVSEYFVHIPMPTSFHCHRHYGIPEGCEFEGGKVYSHGYLSLFAHKFDRD